MVREGEPMFLTIPDLSLIVGLQLSRPPGFLMNFGNSADVKFVRT